MICVSTIVHQAFPNPASTADTTISSQPQLFANALENQNVTIHRHTDGQMIARNPGSVNVAPRNRKAPQSK